MSSSLLYLYEEQNIFNSGMMSTINNTRELEPLLEGAP